MAACPSMIRMSLPSSKRMDRPVGNSPGPEITFKSTAGVEDTAFPEASQTVSHSCTSSVPSVFTPLILLDFNFKHTGLPFPGHSGGAIPAYSFRYQYQERFGIRK